MSRTIGSEWDYWWEHPERACRDDDRYSDLLLEPSRKARHQMILACLSCPVYFECLADLLRFPDSEHYGIRAGIRGLT